MRGTARTSVHHQHTAHGPRAASHERQPLTRPYYVATAAVADTAARTRTRIATIQTEVDGMRGDIGLLQSCWTGTASDSMAACAADWHLTQIQVQSNLDQISLALDNAAVCYDDAETSNQGRFAGSTPAPAPAPTPAPAAGSAPLGAW